jgi:uncharacterized protein (UPF0332 family)
MPETLKELINYRISRAKDTLDDAQILANSSKWNSAINRLYYAAYYAVSALLLKHGYKPTTHTGVKSNFSQYFIKTGKIEPEYGKLFSQLFSWRQKGDYDDMFDFTNEKVTPYFEPVNKLIQVIEAELTD